MRYNRCKKNRRLFWEALMKIVIKKLFGKFNTELEIDKKLNILVGENGVGKSNILKICNLVLNNNYT